MRRSLACLLWLTALAPLAAAEPSPASLWAPRFATPEFVEPGGSFEASVLAAPTVAATGWEAWLTTDLGKRWPCTVENAVWGEGALDLGARSGWRLTVRVTADAVPELCQLSLRTPEGELLVRERAVSVVPDLKSSFYVVCLTDDHLYADHLDAWRPPAQQQTGFHSADLTRLTAQVANLANPRFVLKLGDFSTVQAVSRKVAIQQWFIPALSAFRVPTVISSGNHEHDTWADIPKTRLAEYSVADWEQDFGARSFVTRIGSFYVMSHEFGSYQQEPRFDPALLARVQARYAADATDPSLRFRLVAQHGLDGGLGWFFPESVQQGCDLMISGHDHQTVIRRAGPPYYRLAVAAAEEWGWSVWFSFQRDADGSWTCPQAGPDYSDKHNTVRLLNDARTSDVTLKASYAEPNHGAAPVARNTCTITSQIPFRFHDGRVRFLMGPGRYRVTGGMLLGQYNFGEGAAARTAVVCRVDIPAATTTASSVALSVEPEAN